MKCPNCGAEIGTSKNCSFCGSQISYEMQREQELINKQGCPKCGSSNVTFRRENQGEVRGKGSKKIIHTTVGFCKDCGHTWYPTAEERQKKRRIIWWILGWLFFFPAPVMILIWRKKNAWDIKIKIAVTVVFWSLIFIIAAIGGNGDSSSNEDTSTEVQTQAPAEAIAEPEEILQNNTLYDDAEVLDLMNGFGTTKIGTITVAKAKQADCTEEALLDWYFNYVQKNENCNFHIIAYDDVNGKGVYSLGKGFIQKDTELILEKDGTYSVGDSAGSIFYSVDESGRKLIVQATMADSTVVEDVSSRVDSIIPTEYKNGDLYTVDVAGKEGNLDCNLILVSESFVDSDYQSIAVDIASDVKDLNLGIGYFCISFQSDDYTLNAISSLDNLSSQDASEITTTTF